MDQTQPVEHGHDDASDDAKLSGLIAQFYADLRLGNVHDPEDALRTRLAEADLTVDDARVQRILDGMP